MKTQFHMKNGGINMGFIRYTKGISLHIGTSKTKLSFFFSDRYRRCGCITIDDKRVLHFGKWN